MIGRLFQSLKNYNSKNNNSSNNWNSKLENPYPSLNLYKDPKPPKKTKKKCKMNLDPLWKSPGTLKTPLYPLKNLPKRNTTLYLTSKKELPNPTITTTTTLTDLPNQKPPKSKKCAYKPPPKTKNQLPSPYPTSTPLSVIN